MLELTYEVCYEAGIYPVTGDIYCILGGVDVFHIYDIYDKKKVFLVNKKKWYSFLFKNSLNAHLKKVASKRGKV